MKGIWATVRQLMELRAGWRFVLTGSSARKLKRSGVDLLAKRAAVKTMHPFMAAELGDAFSLEEALTLGMVPLVVDAVSPRDAIGAYVALYLSEEVQMEGLVRNMGNFSRFLESGSLAHGAVLNISDVARDCQVSYYFDAGVFRSVRPAGPLDAPQKIDGAALERLVAQHLRAWNAYRGDRCKLYFWRTKSENEVDFIIYGEDAFCAIEVKNTAKIHTKMLNGLCAFKEDYPEAQTCLLYRGTERIKIRNILCLPCEDFLMNLVPQNPIRL